jgi:hypothetical protein
MNSAEQMALESLVGLVEGGVEFPDAVSKIARQYSYSVDELKQWYDDLPTEAEKFRAFKLMERQGGSFASHLAEAWFYADSTNKKKIETTWQDMIYKYIEVRQ